MMKSSVTLQLYAAVFTPFNRDGTVNLTLIPDLVEHLIREGVDGLFVCGTAGEWSSLSPEERMACAEAYLEANQGRLRTIVHVGDNSIRQARKLAVHAAETGADAVAAVAPFFHSQIELSTLVECCRAVSESVPETAFYYYHIPSLTGLNHLMSDFLVRAIDQIPNFGGLKFSDPDLKEFQACVELAGPDYTVFNGVDEIMFPAMTVGARAAVGATYNFAAPVFRSIAGLLRRGDLERAADLQLRMIRLVKICDEVGYLSAFKAIMGFLGIDCGPLRLPLLTLDEETRRQLREELELIGFFEWGRNPAPDSPDFGMR